MRTMGRWVVMAILAGTVALGAAACGGGYGTQGSGSPSGSPSGTPGRY